MKFFVYIFFIMLISANLFSLNNLSKITEEEFFDNNGNKIAYKIYLKGKKLNDGSYTLAKYFSIPVLPKSEYLPNVIHVKTKKNFSLMERKSKLPTVLSNISTSIQIEDIQAPFERFELPQLKQFNTEGINRIYEVNFQSEMDVYDICKELMENPEVEYAVPVFMRYIYDYTPNDPRLGNAWHLTKIQAAKAWDYSQGDSTIIIGITDSGTDYTHEDLASNIWYNPGETGLDKDGKDKSTNGIDDDGNGFIDDFRGWDFVGNATAPGAWKEDNDPIQGHWHGTHVAGCAAAVTNNAKGVASPGFKCKILPIKCGLDNVNSRGIYRGYDAILYAAQMGAKIINCSWGGPGGSPAEQELINTAYNMGAIIVVAAGNSYKNIDYGNSYPAGYDNVLCVGATRSDDTKAGFSNYGHLVTVYAPGENILSTMPKNAYANQSGTSMATPVLSGICGQLMALHPDWSQKQIMHQIRTTSDNVLTTNPALRPLYYGRANAYRALTVNNPKVSSYERLPGISVASITGDVQVLTNYNNATFKVIVTNYLERAYRTKVKIKPFQNYLSVSQDLINIGTLYGMESDTFDLVIKLLPSTPWFEGKVDILLEFESDSYVDYQIIQIPINLPTKNKFGLSLIFPEENLPLWYSGICNNKNNMMLVGASMNTGNGIFYKSGQAYNTNGITQYPLYTIHAFDESTYYAGSGGNLTQIIKTTNSGSSWTPVDVSAITKFVNYIYFFDYLSGVFIGDPINNVWGVGISSNAGQTWSRVSSIPAPLSGESAYANCAFGRASSIWFGTNKGRIFYTNNKADSWQVSTVKTNAFIHQVYFLDAFLGFCLYGDNQNDKNIKVATTANGGSSWSIAQYDFSTISVTPFYLYSPKDSKMVLTLCKGGEVYYTTDNGKSWKPILTQKYSTVSFGAAFCEFGEGRIWGGETELWSLDFEYTPDNPKKTLTITPGSPIDYQEIEVGKSKTLTFTFENKGNMKITVDSIVIKPIQGTFEKEFDISFPMQPDISSSQSRTLRIKFSPKINGLREADMIVYSNADEKVKTLKLKGTGTGAFMELSFVKDSIVLFDTTEIGAFSTYILRYKNSGNLSFNIDEISMTDNSEFTFKADVVTEILPGQVSNISMTFSPLSAGLKSTYLTIKSEAGNKSIEVIGNAIAPVSVDDSKSEFFIGDLLPNPVDNYFNIIIHSITANKAKLKIYNTNGVLFNEYEKDINCGANSLIIDTENLINGTYYLKIEINQKQEIRKFIKLE
jgi:photosystem II stability/assembly factor-like uncharacterized protein